MYVILKSFTCLEAAKKKKERERDFKIDFDPKWERIVSLKKIIQIITIFLNSIYMC